MNIIVTGSLGNISKPLAKQLVADGHQVTIISSDSDKKPVIESMGAIAAIGSIADEAFLVDTIKDADALYGMIPLSISVPDFDAYLRQSAQTYVQAIKQSNLKRVVLLSGWVADLIPGEQIESVFADIDVPISIIRPGSFYTNFYQSIDLIKGKGIMGKFMALRYLGLGSLLKGRTGLLMGNYGGDDQIVFVSPIDIADAVAEELVIRTPVDKRVIRYVGSEQMSCNEAARIIGSAIGKPWLKWVLLSDKAMFQGLKMAKMPDKLSKTLVEMQSAMHSGKPLENFKRNNPKMGKIKLADFAKEFAMTYHRNN